MEAVRGRFMTTTMMVMVVCIGYAAAHEHPSPPPPFKKCIDPSIKSICSETEYPTVCETSILPFLSGGYNDPAAVLAMQLTAAIHETQTAYKAAVTHQALSATNACDFKCYQYCLKTYKSALNSFNSALVLIQQHRSHEIDTCLDPVNPALKACDQCFIGAKTTISPLLRHYDDSIFKLNTNCLNLRLMAQPEG